MQIPVIETERLRLLPPSVECFEVYRDFYTDAEASKMYGGPINEEQVWARLKADLGSWYLLGFGVWVIQEKSSDILIGTCGFWQGKSWPRELTWWVMPEARGRGVATEASKAALDYARKHYQWLSLETYMNDDNHAARALVEKLGGKKVRRESFSDGLQRDIYQFPSV